MDIYIKGRKGKTCFFVDEQFITGNSPELSDNQCEWMSVVKTMEFISGVQDQSEEFNIFMDSLLVFRQLNGENRIKSKALKPLKAQWNRLKNHLFDVPISYNYISGCENCARSHLK